MSTSSIIERACTRKRLPSEHGIEEAVRKLELVLKEAARKLALAERRRDAERPAGAARRLVRLVDRELEAQRSVEHLAEHRHARELRHRVFAKLALESALADLRVDVRNLQLRAHLVIDRDAQRARKRRDRAVVAQLGGGRARRARSRVQRERERRLQHAVRAELALARRGGPVGGVAAARQPQRGARGLGCERVVHKRRRRELERGTGAARVDARCARRARRRARGSADRVGRVHAHELGGEVRGR